ncbi:AAA family ATPase [Bacillus sp. AK128]
MKPILLSIAGLHSFREKQEVDFEALCEGGVFGIFGPTGSGKSSILDAMTLALYGKVERASNQTQGIMNHAEDELTVSFTFELLHSSGTKRYIVERSFKRADEIRLRAGSCRLIEKTDESIVLADKTGEVNHKIQELLGLTIEDFTRAVVLPQGKFAEFLSLKGVDRRQMLQRLFHLEKYGDQLGKKVKTRLQEANQKVNEVLAEQTGLGDASQEAIDAATKEANDIEILLTKRKKELTEIEKAYDKQTKLWQLEQDKQELIEKLNSLRANEETIQNLSKQVQRSDEAIKLLPYAEELSQTESRFQTTEKKKIELENALSTYQESYQKAELEYTEANKKRIVEEPVLLSQKEKLLGAKELSLSKARLEKELKEVEDQLTSLQEELELEQKRLQENGSLLERGQAKQKELKLELSKVTITSEMREQLQSARDQKNDMEHLNKQLEEQTKASHERSTQIDQTKKIISQYNKQAEAYDTKLMGSFKQIESIYEQICEQERKLEFAKHYSESTIENLRAEQESNREKKLAEHLASRLQEGQPCPVCGSVEHKISHNGEPLDEKDLEAQMGKWKKTLNTLQQAIHHVISLKLSLEQLADTLVNEGVSSTVFSAPLVSLQSNSGVEIEEIETLITEIKAIGQDVLQQKELVQRELKNKHQVQQDLSEQMHVMRVLNDEWDQLKKKIEKLQQEELTAKNKWQNDFPTFNLETFQDRLKELMDQDKEAQALQSRIEKSITFIEEKEEVVNRLKEQVNGLEKKQIELKGQFNYKKERVQELSMQVKQITNDGDVDLLLKETESKLERLYEDEKEKLRVYQELGRKLQGTEGELKTHIELIKDLQQQLEKAKEKWILQSKDTEFKQLDDLQPVILSPTKTKEIKEQLQLYTDQFKQLNHQLSVIENQLGDQVISEESWIQTKELFEEMQEQLQELVEQKGSVNQTLLLLKEKHTRYTELEEIRQQYNEKSEQLGKLQQVLKGNSFVEFLAEEQLVRVARDASERLGLLTRQRYAIEVDSTGGFIMRDDANGGVKRPVNTLSGGETFLTSLALALALSAQIQLRGEYPLQFFFLDEGFGTLDGDLLDTVITALEKLHTNNLSVGVISHVHELRQRLPKKLVVEPAEPSGRGTRVKLEIL